MPSCVLKSCKNNIKKSNKSNGITYHQLPALDARRYEWVEVIRLERGQPQWAPTKHTRICSKHFKDEDKYCASGRIFINKSAVPVLPNHIYENLQEKYSWIQPQVVLDIKRERSSSPFQELDDSTILNGRIEQLLIQKSTLLKICKSLKQKCQRLQQKLLCMKLKSEVKSKKRSVGSRVLRKKIMMSWMDSEILGL